jgi:gentisate 1,2-dioxygenase
MTTEREHAADADGERFERRAATAGLAPLWRFFNEWFTAEPQPAAQPHLWRYDEIRPIVLDSAGAISTADAERRVLVLENPGLVGRRLVTDALYAGLQLIMPGEFARNHRHTAAALRFIVEGENTYTAVAGERCYMCPGDFIVTPAWAWHEHRNEGAAPTIWLDVLDVPLVRFLGAGFSERYLEAEFPVEVPPGDSHYRYGRNLLPAGYRRGAGTASPIFSYPYEQAYETLDSLRRRDDWDECHGLKMEYSDPTTGGPAIPTLSTFLQLLPRGFSTQPYTSTASAVMTAVAGRGRVTIGRDAAARELVFGPKDLWAVPSWQPLTIAADEECVLFCASDEAVHRKLGVFRERRGG